MPTRQINSPGVQINEIDKSQTSPAIVGTSFLVMGYAAKGEVYNPVDIVSTSDLETNFGVPSNEAERYFYHACREILTESGNLIAAKLPYKNDMDENYKYIPINVDRTNVKTYADMVAPTGTIGTIGIPSAAFTDLATSTNIVNYMGVYQDSVQEITNENYDILKSGGGYSHDPQSAEFIITCEKKATVTGTKSDEGVFITLVDPLRGMLVQRIINGDDNDEFNLVKNDLALSGSTFNTELSGTYANTSFSEDCAAYFPTIEFSNNGADISTEYLNWITVIVSKTIANENAQGNLDIAIQEVHSGSLRKDAKDVSSGRSAYIGDIINRNSNYITWYETTPANHPLTLITPNTCLYTVPQNIQLASFSVADSVKEIDGGTMVTDINKVLEKVSNLNERQVDVVVDAGLSTISQFCATQSEFDPVNADYGTIASSTDTSDWRSVFNAFDSFCRTVRKDCMFIGDGPRHLVLKSNQKLIRKTAPDNTIGNTIVPTLKYISGINSSYSAMYIDWFRKNDTTSGVSFWLPPSIKAAGIYARTDIVANYWDAPAGLNRGVVTEAFDLAFNPKQKEADIIYPKAFNYAIQYPVDGIILEGQRTCQVKPSAFDRVNVRRIFLRLERYVYQIARYFVYEPNNEFTRRRLIATIEPQFQSLKAQGALYDYRIVCDTKNNTPTVIDQNELRISILLKPVRTAEFIICDFVALQTGGSFEEYL